MSSSPESDHPDWADGSSAGASDVEAPLVTADPDSDNEEADTAAWTHIESHANTSRCAHPENGPIGNLKWRHRTHPARPGNTPIGSTQGWRSEGGGPGWHNQNWSANTHNQPGYYTHPSGKAPRAPGRPRGRSRPGRPINPMRC